MCFLLIEENDEKTVTELPVLNGITVCVEGFLYEANTHIQRPQIPCNWLKLRSPPSTITGDYTVH